MPTTYRIVCDVDNFKTRDMIQPHRTLVFKRDSKGAQVEALAAFVELMQNNLPCGPKAIARIERSCPRGYTTQLSRYETAPSGLRWILDMWHEADKDSLLPQTIGRQGSPGVTVRTK